MDGGQACVQKRSAVLWGYLRRGASPMASIRTMLLGGRLRHKETNADNQCRYRRGEPKKSGHQGLQNHIARFSLSVAVKAVQTKFHS